MLHAHIECILHRTLHCTCILHNVVLPPEDAEDAGVLADLDRPFEMTYYTVTSNVFMSYLMLYIPLCSTRAGGRGGRGGARGP